jgi:outer membrane lipoprotein SlyB
MRVLAGLLSFSALTVWAQTCLVCGEIRSIREVHDRGSESRERATPGSPQGLDTGPVVGTVAQFHFGKNEGWNFGATGTPEMQARLGETTYEVTVQMDMGERRVLQRRDGNRFHVGQRVALRAGELEPM